MSGNTFGAINDYDFPDTTRSCTTYSAGGRDIVYKFSANANDHIGIDIDITGTTSTGAGSFDSYLRVYDLNWNLIAQNNNAPGPSAVTGTLEPV